MKISSGAAAVAQCRYFSVPRGTLKRQDLKGTATAPVTTERNVDLSQVPVVLPALTHQTETELLGGRNW